MDNFKQLSLIYCYPYQHFESPTFSMLTKPFDMYVWISIFFVILTVSLIYRDWEYGQDICWTLVMQPVQKTWSYEWSILFIMLNFLTTYFLDYVTTDLIKPRHEKQIDTLDELLSWDN